MEIRDKSQKVKKGVILGGIALVALGTAGYFSFFYPPSGKHLAGTIAPAARYRAEQIAKSDVKVAETDITRWTQTAEFDHLSKDPAARKLFANAAFTDALANQSVRQALTSDAFVRAMNDATVRQALSSEAFVKAMNDAQIRQALSSDAFVKAMNDAQVRQALSSDAFAKAMNNAQIRQALTSEAMNNARGQD